MYTKTSQQIGKGSFATVYLALQDDTQDKVAVKQVVRREQTPDLLRSLQQEIAVLQLISYKSPYLLQLLDVQESPLHIQLYTELCDSGTVHELIRNKYTSGLSMVYVAQFTHCMKEALKVLHEFQVCHRDIKSHNLLLSSPVQCQCMSDDIDDIELLLSRDKKLIHHISQHHMPIVKLADFGFARVITPSRPTMRTQCGSPLYMAPEILDIKHSGVPYDAKVDLWSLGTVIYEMVEGRVPFHGAKTPKELLKWIRERKDVITFSDEKHVSIPHSLTFKRPSLAFKNLIRSMLKQKVSERIDFEEFFDHPQTAGLEILEGVSYVGTPLVEASYVGATPSPMRTIHPRTISNASSIQAPVVQVEEETLAESFMPFAMDELTLERRKSQSQPATSERRRRYSSREGINGPSPLMPNTDKPSFGKTTSRLFGRLVSDFFLGPQAAPEDVDEDDYVVL